MSDELSVENPVGDEDSGNGEVDATKAGNEPTDESAINAYSGVQRPLRSLHMATAQTVVSDNEEVLAKAQMLASSYAVFTLQMTAVAALYVAVAMPSCHANRQCPNSMYC